VTRAAGRVRAFAGLLPVYASIAWSGLVRPRVRRGVDVIQQAVVLSERGVLLAVRGDLRGWELPGGSALAGEADEAAVCREVREETGVLVEVEARVGDYVRSGFRPHVARVWRCRAVGGEPRPSDETLAVAWFDPAAPPEALFPWYRAPLADALARLPAPALRHERLGAAAVLAGMRIDLRMRLAGRSAPAQRAEGERSSSS
jgi:8-oxo-dGTP pyrophosphatase MutT (NUDIX family)